MAGLVTYVILFRGVGGATQLPTAPLRQALAEAGFTDVATYINSGNAILRSHLPRGEVIATIAALCRQKFGFTKDIHAPTLAEWRRLVRANPYPEAEGEGRNLHAAILAAAPKPADVAALRALANAGEGIEVIGRVAYILTPGGVSGSKMAARFDKGIGVPNTARNWNTVRRLLAMAEAADGQARAATKTGEG